MSAAGLRRRSAVVRRARPAIARGSRGSVYRVSAPRGVTAYLRRKLYFVECRQIQENCVSSDPDLVWQERYATLVAALLTSAPKGGRCSATRGAAIRD